jgi:hypothetical protein
MRPFSLPGEGQDEGIENHDAVRTSPHPTFHPLMVGTEPHPTTFANI